MWKKECTRSQIREISPHLQLGVARGWESKSVEQQQEAREEKATPAPQLSPQQLAALRKRRTAALAREQVLQQLQHARDPRRRQQLEAALAHLDRRLAGNE